MKTTIGSDGRLAIPKKLREQLGLVPGTPVEVWIEGEEIRIRESDKPGGLIEEDGLLVFHGTRARDVDVTEWIHRQREDRARNVMRQNTD